MKTTLVILAAGMGSRYGGLKQIDPVGPHGEVILNYSVYDAAKAGFDKAVFIIKKEIEKDFYEIVAPRVEKLIDVDYAFQELDMLPEGFSFPERVKPWGTSHALICAADKISTPFAVINADDYYGKHAYEILHNNLLTCDNSFIVGYKLKNTLSENGTVTRGICSSDDGILTKIIETKGLDKNSPYSPDTLVSMNMWGLKADFPQKLKKDFPAFLNNMKNSLTDEYLLPSSIDSYIQNEGMKVNVFDTDDKWFGVTYREDKAAVTAEIKKLTDNGEYEGI